MADPLTFSVIFRELLGKFVAPSHNTCEITLNRIQVHLLEMEDVLFHLNSAVMMPERPMGKTSTKTSEDQDKISGLQTLAISFKQFEFDPRKRLLISGHSDT